MTEVRPCARAGLVAVVAVQSYQNGMADAGHIGMTEIV